MKSEDRVFPQVTKGDKNAGITVRDYIAIQLGNGLLSNQHAVETLCRMNGESGGGNGGAIFGKLCYEYADSLIEESENGRG